MAFPVSGHPASSSSKASREPSTTEALAASMSSTRSTLSFMVEKAAERACSTEGGAPKRARSLSDATVPGD